MACMEYECRSCGEFWSNNHPNDLCCRNCGSVDVRQTFDESRAEHEDRGEHE
jgi:hypothetical protein